MEPKRYEFRKVNATGNEYGEWIAEDDMKGPVGAEAIRQAREIGGKNGKVEHEGRVFSFRAVKPQADGGEG